MDDDNGNERRPISFSSSPTHSFTFSALQLQLDAKRRQLSSLSAEKRKKKHEKLRRHEAKLKEQIAQMEEQCKLIQQERESSTSADESAAGSPYHTPKAASTALATGVTAPLPPSVSAMANKSGAAASESIVDGKDLANRVSC